ILKAEQKLNLAIQYAYLSAKAIEYEYARSVDTWPRLQGTSPYDIYTARTVGDIDDYRLYLQRIRQQFIAFAPSPKAPTVRLASDIAPDDVPFSEWLESHIVSDTNIIEIPFQTTLEMRNNL